MASPTRSVGTTKTASCGAFNVAFVAYLIAMMVGAAEQHAQIPSTPGTAIGVGFCAAALAFTLSEFALWALRHQPARAALYHGAVQLSSKAPVSVSFVLFGIIIGPRY